MSKLDLCLERLRGEEFDEHLWTDRLTVPQVADRIAASAGLTLAPEHREPPAGPAAPRTGRACAHPLRHELSPSRASPGRSGRR
ncbi:hypothetical protein GCM10020229_14540 [Kitasatospora albolonga]